MPLVMTRPTRHPKSGVFRLRKVIPRPLRDAARHIYGVRTEFIESLGTKNEAEARRRAPAILAEIERKLENCRKNIGSPPQPLSHLQCVAIAGEWRKAQLALNEATPGSIIGWEEHRDILLEAVEHEPDEPMRDYEPTPRDILEAEGVAAKHGIVANRESLSSLAQALWVAKVQYAETMIRRARGDYGEDEYVSRYPDRAVITESLRYAETPRSSAQSVISFEALVRGHCRDQGIDPDARPISEAYDRKSRFARHLAAFVGHDDARAISEEDAVRWKEKLLDDGKALQTVANHLSALSAVWAWGVKNKKTEINPFAGLASVPRKKKGGRESTQRPFTAEEAAHVLKAARLEKRATLRWVPWVLALTGARLAEVVQARREDLFAQAGLPFLRVHEEQTNGEIRSVKNGASIRNIPIHPALIAEGFCAYVASLPEGSALFPDSPPDRRYGNRSRTATKAVSRWVRHKLDITDEAISPCHSWRHWFIDAARECIDNFELRNAITGHTDDINESHRYGLGYRAKPERLHGAIRQIRPPIEPLNTVSEVIDDGGVTASVP